MDASGLTLLFGETWDGCFGGESAGLALGVNPTSLSHSRYCGSMTWHLSQALANCPLPFHEDKLIFSMDLFMWPVHLPTGWLVWAVDRAPTPPANARDFVKGSSVFLVGERW